VSTEREQLLDDLARVYMTLALRGWLTENKVAHEQPRQQQREPELKAEASIAGGGGSR